MQFVGTVCLGHGLPKPVNEILESTYALDVAGFKLQAMAKALSSLSLNIHLVMKLKKEGGDIVIVVEPQKKLF